MPTYVYACKDCGHGLEVVQSFTDEALTICPECQGNLRKKFNSVGVVFKGSGFYRNDSRATTSSATPATSESKPSEAAAAPAPAAAPAKESASA
ncbi:FmdB family transcriptional regulator [Paeniglutamicibacter gangotriensis]|uniref:FmdB family transcriptional regulator n=1 Tax=Paeniglutamicibacter gangotriensis TaxID=254787 RepID=A0A5B0EHM9_9MICC|nr:FmdB family zinc ribbon protein [Paeniglutamicibacter gangotriensis]KAA0977942.1 FmdB family transcriptional regulator [Paeniglutamicibacter gangotriensis]